MGRKEPGANDQLRRSGDVEGVHERARVRAAAAALEKLRRLDAELAARLEGNPAGLRRRSTDRR